MTGITLVIDMLGNTVAQHLERIAVLEAELSAERERRITLEAAAASTNGSVAAHAGAET